MFLPAPNKPDDDLIPRKPKSASTSAHALNGEEIRFWALECLVRGDTPAQVRVGLRNSGYTPAEAEEVLNDAIQMSTEGIARTVTPQARWGVRWFLIGCSVFTLGFLASCGSAVLAFGSGASVYYVFSGIMVVGMLLGIRGMREGGLTALLIRASWRANRVSKRVASAASQAGSASEKMPGALGRSIAAARRTVVYHPGATRASFVLAAIGLIVIIFVETNQRHESDPNVWSWRLLGAAIIASGLGVFVFYCRRPPGNSPPNIPSESSEV
jgi:hypothetical protein